MAADHNIRRAEDRYCRFMSRLSSRMAFDLWKFDMSAIRLTDRDEVPRLNPEAIAKDKALVEIVRGLRAGGSVYHVLGVIPEQCEDIYTILVDDVAVIEFEIAHHGSGQPEEVKIWLFDEYRRSIGQGKARMKLDHAAAAARKPGAQAPYGV